MKKFSQILTPVLLQLSLGFGLIFQGTGQTPEIDSLRNLIYSQPDQKGKVDNIIQLSRRFYLGGFYDSVITAVQPALRIAEKIPYRVGMADAYYLQSSALKMKGDFNGALTLVDQYLEIYISIQDSLRLARGYYNLGTLYKELEEYDLSIYNCQKSLSYAIPIHEVSLAMSNYNCLGAAYINSHAQFDSAAHYYLKAIEIIENTGNNTYYTTVLNNLGDVYFLDKQYALARSIFNKCMELNLQNNLYDRLALNYLNLGRTSIEENKTEEALENYKKALGLYIEINDQRGIADINNNIGDVYFKLGNYEQALKYFNNALAFYKEKSFFQGIIITTLNKAAIISEQGNTAMAKKMQDSTISLAREKGNVKQLIYAYRNIADNYYKSGDYKNAYINRLEFELLSDSIFNIERTKAINALQLKYEKGKSDARILELEKENLKKTNQRNAYMFTGIAIVVVTLFIIIYFRQKSRHDRIVTEQKILQLQEEKKLMAAKLLVEGQEEERKRIATELHDGIGVLLSATRMQFSMISEKSSENKEIIEKASRMLEQASGDVRKISHNMMPGLLTKLGFLEATEDLFEGISDAGKISAVCVIDGEQKERLPENKEIMLYRVIQEMVNNTLKHAKARNIILKINILADAMDIIYTDDGIGFDYREKMNNESLGLKSIQSRVNFLNGTFQIESNQGCGVKYGIHVPA